MGQNRRYGMDREGRQMNEFLIRARPISLSHDELGDEPPLAPEPVEVEAWVRFPEHAIRVQGRAVAWTERAVWVEFTMLNGQQLRAWVWAGAVRKR